MSKGNIAEVIQAEAAHWPGVQLAFTETGKHRRALFQYGGKEKFVVMPNTPSDWRGAKNSIKNVRGILRNLGAERIARPPVSKREQDLMETQDFARLAVNNKSIVFTVPRRSGLHGKFVENDHVRSYWTFQLRSNPDPAGGPLFVVKKHPAPAAGETVRGFTTGGVNKAGGAFIMSISSSLFPAIEARGPFGSSAIELKEQTEDEAVFYMPKVTRPVAAPNRKPAPPKPAIVARTPEPQSVPAPTPAAPITLPDGPIYVQLPREPISLEDAIDIVNEHKRRKCRELTLNINDDGFLYAHCRMGIR